MGHYLENANRVHIIFSYTVSHPIASFLSFASTIHHISPSRAPHSSVRPLVLARNFYCLRANCRKFSGTVYEHLELCKSTYQRQLQQQCTTHLDTIHCITLKFRLKNEDARDIHRESLTGKHFKEASGLSLHSKVYCVHIHTHNWLGIIRQLLLLL